VRKNPAPWLWMYKHWRYLPANADRPYPFYANFYRPFQDMLEDARAADRAEGDEENEG
jgi:Kdo2-lipid IVA lauroyltransferase/acyltransferase